MRKQKFFESETIVGKEDQKQNSSMQFEKKSKSLNDLLVLRMIFLDHFFLFMGMNNEKAADGTILNQDQYLFLMKGDQVKIEYKIHKSVLFLEKNIDNFLKNKYIVSLGIDEFNDPSQGKQESALVLKIWDFMSLDDYTPANNQGRLTGGSVWDD